MVLVPHIIKPRFYWTKIDQNSSPELLNLLFKHIFHKNITKHNKTSHIRSHIFPHWLRLAGQVKATKGNGQRPERGGASEVFQQVYLPTQNSASENVVCGGTARNGLFYNRGLWGKYNLSFPLNML